MVFPNFQNKHAEDSMISPADYLAYAKKTGQGPKFKPPVAVIMCYSNRMKEHVLESHKTTQVSFGAGEVYLMDDTGGRLAIIAGFGIGAPAAVTVLEEFIALGVRKIMSIGSAGSLQKNIKVGDIVVCDKAIRDEGTSHHYIKRSKYAYASKDLTGKAIQSLEKAGMKYTRGTSWTIDAPYRETIAEARHYQAEGILTVEMEASALFAVGKYRGVDVGAIFTISDSLAELEWKPKFHVNRTKKGLEIIADVAIDVLVNDA